MARRCRAHDRPRQLAGQLALVACFQCQLPDLFHPESLLCLRHGCRSAGPGLLQRGKGPVGMWQVATVQQDGAPGQPDGQQFAQVHIARACLRCLPLQVGTPRRPAVDGQQQRFQVIRPHLGRQAQPGQHPLLCQRRGGGQAGQLLAQPGQSHQHADAVVVLQCFAPESVEALARLTRFALGLPVGLVVVEIRRAGLADLVCHGLTPGQVAGPVWGGVEQVGQQGQRLRWMRLGQCGHASCFVQPRALAGRHLCQCSAQVLRRNAAAVPGLLEMAARGVHLRAAQQRQPGSHAAHRQANALPVRVDRYRLVQRPGRCDGLAGALAGLVHGGMDTGLAGVGGCCGVVCRQA